MADAYAYFVSRAAKLARAHGKRPIQWAEVFDEFGATLDKSTVVHVWKPSTNITEVVESGYDCLVNVGYVADSWYLDNLDATWDRAYGVDLRAAVPPRLQAKVLGGHGEMWGRARRVVFDGTIERRGLRCSRRRDGGRLGF